MDTPEFAVAYTQTSRRSTIGPTVQDMSTNLARQGIPDDLILSPAKAAETSLYHA
ncbi:MAG: hypothetical protein ACU0B7_10215 [Paracoccaceae bacterium]